MSEEHTMDWREAFDDLKTFRKELASQQWAEDDGYLSYTFENGFTYDIECSRITEESLDVWIDHLSWKNWSTAHSVSSFVLLARKVIRDRQQPLSNP